MFGEKSNKQVVKQYVKRLTHFCSIWLLSQVSFYNLGSKNVLTLERNIMLLRCVYVSPV